MKKLIKVSGLMLIFFLSAILSPAKATAQQPYISYQVFYDQLSPYGQWVNFQNYGYVWLPDAGWDFVPYSTGGYWIMTEYGWTWLSEYDWGWAPFHYGRWDFDNNFGWFWVPGNEWGPAWVTWRRSSGYYGWTPMRPGVNISLSFGNSYDNYINHPNQWMFINERYFGRNDMYRHYANYNDIDIIFRSSVVIYNTHVDNRRQTTYFSGPDPADVRRATGRTVSSYGVRENSTPGHEFKNREYYTYRPQVIIKDNNPQEAAPARITRQQDLRRPSERNPENLYRSNSGLQVQKQNEEFRQDEVIRKNSENQQNAIITQNEVYQQNNANRQREDIKENAAIRQTEIDQQNAAVRHNEVNKQNAANRQRAVDQQNAVYQRSELNRQKAIERPNAVRNETEVKPQVIQQNNNGQNSRRENLVKPAKPVKEKQSGNTKGK